MKKTEMQQLAAKAETERQQYNEKAEELRRKLHTVMYKGSKMPILCSLFRLSKDLVLSVSATVHDTLLPVSTLFLFGSLPKSIGNDGFYIYPLENIEFMDLLTLEIVSKVNQIRAKVKEWEEDKIDWPWVVFKGTDLSDFELVEDV